MATACCSPALSFVLLSVMLSTLAVSSSATPGSTSLQKACHKTELPDYCLEVLTAIPGCSTASPRRLSELAFHYLTEQGPALQAEAQRVTAATTNQTMLYCLGDFNTNIARYVEILRGIEPESGAADFTEAKHRLSGILDYPSNSGMSCDEDEMNAMPVTVKIKNYEAMMQITLDLMRHAAPRSHRPPADPPSSEGGAPAPWMARAPSA
ncbi:hypothetical protein QOZ80_7AG0561860 [Eleusine coracana subsp. coracana]|nr:hypothetical protein QOZ80_7AG0561860 [Eleusine coracana subsp. coracana]